jgi:hypothetical protein
LIVDEKGRERLAKAIAVAMQRAGRTLPQDSKSIVGFQKWYVYGSFLMK